MYLGLFTSTPWKFICTVCSNVLANSAGPDEMPHYAALVKCSISSGSSVFAKVHV